MPKPKQAAGRPRDRQVDHAIARATRELLAERGYAKLTVDAVASRAGVGKAAIYRRFDTKQEMIFAASVHDMEEAPPPDSGSLRGDLAAVCATIGTQLTAAPPDVLHGLLADIHGDTALGARFTASFIERERFVIDTVLARALERGELPAAPDAAQVHSLLIGPVFFWLLILTGERDRLRRRGGRAIVRRGPELTETRPLSGSGSTVAAWKHSTISGGNRRSRGPRPHTSSGPSTGSGRPSAGRPTASTRRACARRSAPPTSPSAACSSTSRPARTSCSP
jgi:AcrR family transcriptional regulator